MTHDMTMPSIGAEIDEVRSELLPSPKRKLGEIGDGGSQPPPAEKKPLEHETEESESESEGDSEVMKLPDYMVEYYKKISDILGVEIGVGTLGGCVGDEFIDEDDELVGDKSILFAYPELQEIWGGPDPVMCCSHPFSGLEFKHDTKLYNDLKAFGENAVKDLNARYSNYEGTSFQDIQEVTSCHAPCNHHVVTLKAIDRSDHVLQIVLRGQLPLGDFAQAKPNQFIMLEYCRVR